MTTPNAWNPLGRALEAYADGDFDAAVRLELEDGSHSNLPAHALFRADGLTPIDETALSLAHGRVLDAGAGAGALALALAGEDLDVVALDIDPRAVAVMQRRGVKDARLGDLLTIDFGRGADRVAPFDTVVMLMNGMGVAGTVAGLESLFLALHRLVAPGGMVLADSADLQRSDDPTEHRRMVERERQGRYPGEVRYRMSFGDEPPSPAFSWLFADPDVLTHAATQAGWWCQLVFEDDDGSYLARFTRID